MRDGAYAPLMPQQNTPAPSPAPTVPTPPDVPSPVLAPGVPEVASPRTIYLGLREKREVLWNVKSRLENEREEIVEQIRQGPASDADRAGLEQRLAAIDQQIAKVSIDIAEADAAVAAGAAIPGALQEETPRDRWANGPPPELVALGMGLTAALLFPVALAWARRLWRKANVISAVPAELTDRVGSIERNLETVALEIERIGEGQRFVTQLLASRVAAAAARAPAALPGRAPGSSTGL